jgi:hypothetical protein
MGIEWEPKKGGFKKPRVIFWQSRIDTEPSTGFRRFGGEYGSAHGRYRQVSRRK